MQRYGSVIRLRPDHRETYLRLHEAVWPSVEQMLLVANIRNFSIFLHGDLLFSYYEYEGEDHEADMARVAADPQTQEWWKLTDPCQEPIVGPDDGPEGGRWWTSMREVWHLGDAPAGETP